MQGLRQARTLFKEKNTLVKQRPIHTPLSLSLSHTHTHTHHIFVRVHDGRGEVLEELIVAHQLLPARAAASTRTDVSTQGGW